MALDGDPVVRPILPIAISLDHRFVDGYQAATMAKIFREYLADPGRFDPLPAVEKAPARLRRVPTINGNGHRRLPRPTKDAVGS